MKNIIVVILIIFIVGIFGYLGYVLFYPKNQNVIKQTTNVNVSAQVSSVLQSSVNTNKIKPVRLKYDPFFPLMIKLDQTSFIELIKNSDLSTIVNHNVYVVGMVKGITNMVTLYVSGKFVTLNFTDNSIFNFEGKNYLVSYIDPALGSTIIMDLSTGNLYVVNSRGLILR